MDLKPANKYPSWIHVKNYQSMFRESRLVPSTFPANSSSCFLVFSTTRLFRGGSRAGCLVPIRLLLLDSASARNTITSPRTARQEEITFGWAALSLRAAKKILFRVGVRQQLAKNLGFFSLHALKTSSTVSRRENLAIIRLFTTPLVVLPIL